MPDNWLSNKLNLKVDEDPNYHLKLADKINTKVEYDSSDDEDYNELINTEVPKVVQNI